jgi:hypothetical protein
LENEMKIENIAGLITRSYMDVNRRKKTLFFVGPSGVGKSDAVRQGADEIAKLIGDPNFGYLDFRLAQKEPVEFSGVPSVTADGFTRQNPPDWLPRPGTNGIIILDEITSAPQIIQAAAYQFCLDRRFGDTPLPDGWMVVAAGNRMSDRGVTYPMAAPLLARMTKINVESSLDGFIEYCAQKGVRGEIIAFVKSRPDYLNERDEKINTKISELPLGEPFATQRGWTTAAQYYLDDPAEDRSELLRGCIGARAGADLEAFLRIWQSMPSIDQIFKDPESVPQPNDSATRYAVAVGVSMRIDTKNFAKAKKYLDHMPGEFKSLAIKLAYKRDPTIVECDAFNQWVIENPHLFKRGA